MSTIDDVLASRIPFAVECSRAEDFATRLPDGCASMLWCDIPYHRAISAEWDNVWPTDDAFLAWVGGLCEGWRRILAPNGSIYVFASPAMAWAVEGVVRQSFEVLTNIRWKKPFSRAEASCKEDLRSPFPASETVLFCEQRGADLTALGLSGYAAKDAEARGLIFEPLRAYLDGERKRAGIASSTVQKALGNQMAGHYFGRSQWCLPTEENHAKLQELLDREGAAEGRPYLRRDYEALRRDYEALRRDYEALRRPFFATPERPYTDVWTYPTVPHYDGKHPCEKPYPMCEDAVLLSTRPGDLVVDLFCGAGGIGSAAVANGRRFIGGDMDKHWADFTRRRCEMTKATGQTTVRKIHKPNSRMPSLALMLEQET